MTGRKYTKKEIIKILHQSAKKYQENLLNKKIIFIYKNKDNLDFIEALFKDSNFMHLTGIKYKKGANQFFIDCIQSKINSNDIEIKNKIFTSLKLQILENAMSINKSAKRIGIYNDGKTNIKIEKVIGNTHYCLGFSNLNNKGKEIIETSDSITLKGNYFVVDTPEAEVYYTMTGKKMYQRNYE